MKGFSLIETIIYLALLSVLILAVVPTVSHFESARMRAIETSVDIEDDIFWGT